MANTKKIFGLNECIGNEPVYFIKSVLSGQIYAMNFIPEYPYAGFERVTEEEYIQYLRKLGYKI